MRRVRLLGAATALLTVILLLTGVLPRHTASAQAPVIEPKSAVAVNFAESIPLRDLPAHNTSRLFGEDDFERANKELPKSLNATETGDLDGAIGFPSVAAPAPPALLSFEGLSNQDNFANFGFRLSPPDNDGEVGPHHFAQYINLLFRIYDKTGAPLTPPVRLSSLYAPLGGQCAEPDNGDPIVLYDQLADRWVLSQFAFIGAGTEPPYHECIAISKTGDPTGSYYLYDFLVPTAQFNDYPKLGVWLDGYYMTANQFNRGLAFDGTGVFAFNRTKMILGDPTANMIYFDLNLSTHPEGIGGMLPSDLDGLNPPPDGSPNVFAYFLANEFGDAIDGLRLFDFHADFENPASSTFIERQAPLPVPAFDPRSPAGRADIEQPPPAVAAFSLDSISDRLMFRLAYRNFGEIQSLVVNHSVNVGTGVTLATHQAGVRYYELRRTLQTGPFSVHVAETIAPDAVNRWMGSAAQDNDGNIAVGYSVSSLSVFPGIRYSGRLADGSPRTETSIIEGSGVQRSTGSRWGDYTAISIDPVDDCTFWYTNQYYTAASQASSTVGWLTRNGAFKFPECTPAPRATLTGTVTNQITGLPISGALIDLGGGHITSTGPDGVYTIYVLPDQWVAKAIAPNYRIGSRTRRLTNGGTVIADFALLPIGADVVITKTGPAQSAGFVDLAYQITVGNLGPLTASNVRVFDPIPPGTTFVSAVPSQGNCSAPAPGSVGQVTCNLGAIGVGDSATIALTLRSVEAVGTVRNTATVLSGTRDEIKRNNEATATTRITCGTDITVSGGPIGTAPVNGLQPGRLFRSGAPSVCGFPKAFPGYSAPTDRVNRRFDLYSFTNEGPAECITVEVTAAASCSTNLLYAVAYLGDYNPGDLSQNFLADSGSSPSPAVGAPTVAFSFDLPAGATFKLVIHEVNPPPTSCGAYSFKVIGLPQACPVLTLAAAQPGAVDVGPFSRRPAERAVVAYSTVPRQ
jgi:uncharacterized repeat protein (TIGR01451 family)